jgi:glycosyltransferase involved in cell wall biosynthesis
MLVSVLMSVYNSEDHLDSSIQSILNQTYKDFEFIIIDDGSKDKSVSIIEKYAAADPRIILIKNERNLGLASSLNKGIQLAKGKYIARQDADDLSVPERLETQLNYAITHEDVDIVASNSYIIDIHGNLVCETKKFSRIKNYYDKLLNRKAIFIHGSAFLKTSKLLEVGLYDSRFYYSQDGEYWLRLISNGAKVHIIEQSLYYYREAPLVNNKKHQVKSLYNRVKNMIYVENEDVNIVDTELRNINQILSKNTWQPYSFYMAEYWKNLANKAYLNNSDRATCYRYLGKAFREKNSPGAYPRYFLLSVLYLIPNRLTSKVLNLRRKYSF